MSRTPGELHAKRIQWAIQWTRRYHEEHRTDRADRQWPSQAQINAAIKEKFGVSMRPKLVYELREAAGGPAIERGKRKGKPPKEGQAKPSIALHAADKATSYGPANATLQVKTQDEANAIRSAIEATNAAGLTNLAVDIDQGKLGVYVLIKGR